MNAKLYRHVFSKVLGCLVAVSDIARGEGGEGITGDTLVKRLQLRPLSIALAMIFGSAAVHAQTLPTGGAVVGGLGNIVTSGNTLTVQQNSARLAVNWDTFNVGAGNTVEFKQPSKTSVALNRVLGSDPSKIYGKLQSNGQVFLINPNGVLFGKSAQVKVGGLFASTLSADPAAFMAGKFAFTGGAGASGEVINQGNLRADNGGFVVLAGNRVINTGTISATSGTVVLAAGNSVTLALDNAGHATVNVTSAALSALIQNQGLIEADGGQVVLTARGRDMLQSSVMNLSGVIQANTIGTQNGQVVISGGDPANGDSGTVSLTNLAVNAVGSTPGTKGGSVTVTGPAIELHHSVINVSGVAGGGNTFIGGGARGTGPLAHAKTVSMDASSKIDASATGKGNGGAVVLWSDNTTVMDGAILARGGQLGGNGGSVETSSKGQLGVRGSVSAGAPRGKKGTWLLDPTDITVSSAPDANNSAAFTRTVNNASLVNALATTDVTLDARSIDSGTGGSINVTADIISTGNGNLTLNADNGKNVTLGANISLGTGSFTAIGGSGIATGSNGGSVVLNAGNTLSAANVTLTGGDAGPAGGVGRSGNLASAVGTGGNGSAGGYGGSVVVNGTISAIGAATLMGGAGAGGGGGGGGGGASFFGADGGLGGNGGAGGSILINANISAASIKLTTGAGGSGGGGGGAGSTSNVSNVLSRNGAGGKGGDGGYAGTLELGNATVHATGLIKVVGGNGGGGGGGGASTTASSGLGQAGGAGTYGGSKPLAAGGGGTGGTTAPTTTYGGGTGGYSSQGAGGIGGMPGAGAGSGLGGGGGRGGNGGQGGVVNANGNVFLTGGNVSFTTLTPIVITTNSSNLTFNFSGTSLIGNQITNNGNLTREGSGNMTFTNQIIDNGNVTLAGSGNTTFSGVISTGNGRVGNLIFSGSGTNWLTSINTYNGTTLIYSGSTLKVGDGTSLAEGTLGSGAVINNGNLYIQYLNDITLSKVVSSAAGITGSGILALVSSNNVVVDRAITLTGAGTIYLAAGINGRTGSAAGGDVTLLSKIATGAAGTIGIFSGNPNTAGLLANMSGANGATAYKAYNSGFDDSKTTIVAGTRNFVYRQAASEKLTGALTKPYDGTNSANLVNGRFLLTGIDGDSTSNVSAVRPGATYTNATFGNQTHVGSGLSITATPTGNMTYTDAGGTNWSVSRYNQSPLISDARSAIVPANVNVTAASQTKTFDGTTLSNGTVNVTGLVGGDSLTGLTQSYNNPHVQGAGNSTLAVNNNGTLNSPSLKSLASDYNITYYTAPGTITPYAGVDGKGINVSASPSSKPYDGTTASNQSVTNVTGLLNGESLTGLSEYYNSPHANVPNYLSVNNSGAQFSNGSYLSDYALNYNTAPGTINPLAVRVAAQQWTKTYDGNTSSGGIPSVTPLLSGDSLTNVTQSFNSSHALGFNNSTLTASSGTLNSSIGSLAGDYAITYINANGTINQYAGVDGKGVNVTASPSRKTYDGTTGSNTPVTNVTGLLPGDSLTGLSEYYNSSHAQGGNGSLLSVNHSGAGVTGAYGSVLSDYLINYYTALGTIDPLAAIVTSTPWSKPYDGTTASNQTAGVTGLLPGDTLTGLGEVYNSPHALGPGGSTLGVNPASVGVKGTGSDPSKLGDYAITYVNGKGTIVPLPANVTATPADKPYDGTTASNAPVTNVTGLLLGDKLTGLTQSYNNSNALGPNGSTLSVNPNNVGVASPIGSLPSDYALNYSNATGTVKPIPLAVTNVTSNGDGTLNTTGQKFIGLIPGDKVNVIPGNTPGTLALAGPSAANYVLSGNLTGVLPPGTVIPPPVPLKSPAGDDEVKRLAAVQAAEQTQTVMPPAWLTLSQSPRSAQMREIADTGQLPATGPVNRRSQLPSTSLLCVQGAIRFPDAVAPLPVDGCGPVRKFANG